MEKRKKNEHEEKFRALKNLKVIFWFVKMMENEQKLII